MSLFLFFALFVLVLVIYLIFFKMMYLSYEKLQSQHDAGPGPPSPGPFREEQYRHICASIESSRRMNHDLRHHMITLQAFCRADVFRTPATIWSSTWIPRGRSSLWSCAATRWSTWWWGIIGPWLSTRIFSFSPASRFRQLSVSDIDLSVILGNLLENAIDAADCGEGDERFIQSTCFAPAKCWPSPWTMAFTMRSRKWTGDMSPASPTTAAWACATSK